MSVKECKNYYIGYYILYYRVIHLRKDLRCVLRDVRVAYGRAVRLRAGAGGRIGREAAADAVFAEQEISLIIIKIFLYSTLKPYWKIFVY